MLPLTLFVAAALVGSAALVPQDAVTPLSDRIRPLDTASERLIAQGLDRSPTISALVDRLMHSTVVVYVASAGDLRVPGVLTFIARAGGLTYVCVRIQPMIMLHDRLPVLGHELQHAVEIADAGDQIAEESALEMLYRKIGFQSGRHAFESEGARATESKIRRELTRRADPH
jgi:hypothetical protein